MKKLDLMPKEFTLNENPQLKPLVTNEKNMSKAEH
jgi:hypothetical protein